MTQIIFTNNILLEHEIFYQTVSNEGYIVYFRPVKHSLFPIFCIFAGSLNIIYMTQNELSSY